MLHQLSMYTSRGKLKEMGIDLLKVVPKEKYIMEKINDKLEEFSDYIQTKKINFKENQSYIIDLAEGKKLKIYV